MRTTTRHASPSPFSADPLRATGHFGRAEENAPRHCAGCRRQVAAGQLIAWRGLDRCAVCTLTALRAIPLPNRPRIKHPDYQPTPATHWPGRYRV